LFLWVSKGEEEEGADGLVGVGGEEQGEQGPAEDDAEVLRPSVEVRSDTGTEPSARVKWTAPPAEPCLPELDSNPGCWRMGNGGDSSADTAVGLG
jgi:hypothetical protein